MDGLLENDSLHYRASPRGVNAGTAAGPPGRQGRPAALSLENAWSRRPWERVSRVVRLLRTAKISPAGPPPRLSVFMIKRSWQRPFTILGRG
jgi:hypothetical protein